MRQIRVRNDSCEIHTDFQRAIFSCYNHYSKIYEDRDNIHEKRMPEFVWEEIRSFAKNDVWGWFDRFSRFRLNNFNKFLKTTLKFFPGQLSTYSGEGGYIVKLSLNKTIAIQTIEKLKENLWIDRGTRAVFIDFTTYNPNINLYVVTKLIAEFPATGGMFTSWQFRTLNLLENSSQAQIGLYICFIMFLFFIIYYLIEEFFEIKALGFIPYLQSSGWNYLDLFIILISIALVFFLICRQYIITKIFDEAYSAELTDHGYEMNVGNQTVSLEIDTYQFDTLGFWSAQFSNILAVLSFVAWIKIFKYISFNKTMSQLSSTLSRVCIDLVRFPKIELSFDSFFLFFPKSF